MSKELEDRLKVLNEFEKYEGNLEHLSSSNILNVFNELENNLKCIENAYKDRILSLIKKALTPPTADEVCEALSEYLQTIYGKVVIYYENKNFGMEIQHSVDEITSHELVSLLSDNIIYIGENLPPHIITLIGIFYKGEIK